ncbi:LOW QUALITY PROTEIN: Hypothetical protein PHPALM_4718 [Phytophthora palmivora]|uniref:PiggyBac transposable element-derived protein domain-containing protein n=1 Tax=Phytophthora palmivora TaxID=4796 RepID=A0A2P4YJ49_9STRA|nr:LOW QUALITY PROTEIN: Hypothetical protein PHPALM_4718 [Phytophthora palmivora]
MDISNLLNNGDDSSFDWEFDGDEAGASDEEVAHLESDSCDDPPMTGRLHQNHPLGARGCVSSVVLTFFTADFCDALRGWTNEKFREKVKDLTPGVEFDKDVAATMYRHRYQSTRARLHIHPPDSVSAERRAADPLWRCRVLMTEIQKKIATIAVPVGAVSLDENTVWTKARSTAKSYLPSKSDKYGILWSGQLESLCVYLIWDNGSGKKLAASPAKHYVGILPDLLPPLFRTLSRENCQ